LVTVSVPAKGGAAARAETALPVSTNGFGATLIVGGMAVGVLLAVAV